MSRCCICNNKNVKDLHAFPDGKNRLEVLEKWLKFAKLEKVVHLKKRWFLCKNHFTDDAFQNYLRKKLLRTAIPTLNPPTTEIETSLIKAKYDGSKRGEKSPVKKNQLNETSKTGPENSSRLNLFQNEGRLLTIITQDKENANKLSEEGDLLSPNFSSIENFDLSFSNEKDSNSGLKDIFPDNYNNLGSSNLSTKTSRSRSLILRHILNTDSKAHIPNFVTSDKASFIIDLVSDHNQNIEMRKSDSTIRVNVKPTALKLKQRNCSLSSNIKVSVKPIAVNDFKSSPPPNRGCTTADHLEENSLSKSNDEENNENISSSTSFTDEYFAGEEVVSDGNSYSNSKKRCSVKNSKKLPVEKKTYYDPVLIESVLNKMKLKKSGPICVVSLQKKLDKVSKSFTTSKVVTLYKQRMKRKKTSMKLLTGNKTELKKNADKNIKLRKKRKCSCSIHCLGRPNGSKNLPSLVNVSSGVGIKFQGNTVHPNISNISSDEADEEMFNVENVFNVSTILTNIHDKSQIEQLCQMLIETIFRLKNLNIEGTMAKLQVYISQIPYNSVDTVTNDKETPTMESLSCDELNRNDQVDERLILDAETGMFSYQSNLDFSDSDISSCYITASGDKVESIKKGTDSAGVIIASSEVPKVTIDSKNKSNHQSKYKNVKVRLSTLHDHSYIKHESHYLFDRPEYLVKLINIETYRRPKKIRPPQPAVSKKEIERHRKAYQKLSNKIIRLKDLIQKKNKNIKSMQRKLKFLGNAFCEEKGLKRIKYPKDKENFEGEKVFINSVKLSSHNEQEAVKRQKLRKQKTLLDQFKSGSASTDKNLSEMSFYKGGCQKKFNVTSQKNVKKNIDIESFDVLYEQLIEEVCYTDMEY